MSQRPSPQGHTGPPHPVSAFPMTLLMVALVVAVASVIGTLRAPPGPAAPFAEPANVTGPTSGVPGVLTFRGNETRTYLGDGPVPADPVIRWRHPQGGPMCSMSTEGRDGTPLKEWCGVGWTGQPNVVARPGEPVEVREGAYDAGYHFVEAGTGQALRPPLVTGDLAKGSATTDPDGYPLYYAGSRDDLFRIVALDRARPTVLWQLDANDSVPDDPEDHGVSAWWNDDWDGAALVVDGYLLVGGENGWVYVVELRRAYDAQGRVTVSPRRAATFPGFDDELLAAIDDEDVSIESSVAFRDGVLYVANSGGLVSGWDITDLLAGGTQHERVFRYWTGDDTDATVVIDDEGFLYVASEYQRFTQRSRDVGQLMKLDPTRPEDPLVWTIPAHEIGFQAAGGSWSTPAISGDLVVFATAAGRVLGVHRVTGEVAWELQVAAPTISSPVIVDDTLLLGDCSGRLSAWDLREPGATPPLRWSIDLGDCIEATPAVWQGWLYVGTREGYLYGLADAATPAPAS